MKRAALVIVLLPAALTAQRSTLAPLVGQLPLGARAAAMGGTNAGSGDAEAVLTNPALAGMSTTTALSLARYRKGTAGAVVASSSTIGRFGVGLAASYLDYRAFAVGGNRLSSDVLRFPGVDPSASLQAALGVSTTLKGLRMGVSAVYVEERLGLDRAAAVGVSAGVARRLGPGSPMVGLSLQNLAPSLEFGFGEVEVPTRLALGASGAFVPLGAWFDLVLDAGVSVRRDGFVSPAGGAELLYIPIEGFTVALRAGARRPELSRQDAFTGGAGLALDRWSLDYAWEAIRGGAAHRIGVRLR